MRKKVFVLILILMIGIGSLISYGESNKEPNIIPDKRITEYALEDRKSWIEDMFEFRREELKRALEKGLITEEEAKFWKEHFDYMEKFHEENDYMPFGCGGFGRGFMREYGYGGPRMRGNGFRTSK